MWPSLCHAAQRLPCRLVTWYDHFVPDSESERTRVTRQDDRTSTPGVSGPGGACIVVIYGPDLGKRIELGTAVFQIGRSAKNDLFIDQESVSRHHARITFDGRSHWLQDLRSTNGTHLNDELIKERALHDGDQLRIGQTILKYMTGENVELAYHEEIYRLMTVDGLTQIYNRRYFDEVLERELNRSKRYARTLSLVVFDIDHFKQINDTHGHLAGDAVLRQLAGLVRGKLRREDVFARTGGEEFGILLPEITLSGARTTAEKVRRIVETMQVNLEKGPIRCTISLGVTATDETEISPKDLYAKADANLYAAKNGGRNRVIG
jgi:diguanylate cyclase (GGDEF)-like protein